MSTNDFTNAYKRKVDRMAEGTRGYSNYELAVINGFLGTEKEYLDSLKGEKGDKGEPGDMQKSVYDTDNDGIVDNAKKVNGHTVNKDVPSNAKFTDTTYSNASTTKDGLMSKEDKTKLDNIENAIDTLKIAVLKTVFPIGSTYVTQTDTNPATILKFGTWERLKGRVCVGLDENDEYFNEIGKEGGETEHTMTVEELVEHVHDIEASTPYTSEGTGYFGINTYEGYAENPTRVMNGAKATKTGASQPFNVTQPYKVTGYMWIRTA